MKHAFLIIAHNEFDLLGHLVELLDHPDNAFYIHVDLKAADFDAERLRKQVTRSKLSVYREMSVLWGDVSQVRCELSLLKHAARDGYDYYHFLSGSDLPLQPVAEIHRFFKENAGKEWIHFDAPVAGESVKSRVLYRRWLTGKLKASHFRIINKMTFILDHLLTKAQKALRMERKIPYPVIQKGCNWCSISDAFARYALDREDEILTYLDKSFCGDEMLFQTLCVNSDFRERLYNQDFDNNYDACKRLIIWDERNRKSPKTFSNEDWEVLLNSSCLFARKFSLVKEPAFTMAWIERIRKLNAGGTV